MSRCRAWIRMKTGWIPRPVRRAIITVIGGTLLLLAFIGIILPIMPGFIFLPFALAILAVEFAWAARWLKKFKKTAKNVQQRMRGTKATSSATFVDAANVPPPVVATSCDAAVIPLPKPPRNAAA